jgi:hypothetical protein
MAALAGLDPPGVDTPREQSQYEQFVRTDSPYALWPLDEVGGQDTMRDVLGFNHGQFSGTVRGNSTWPRFPISKYFIKATTDGHFSKVVDTGFFDSAEQTYEVWVRPNASVGTDTRTVMARSGHFSVVFNNATIGLVATGNSGLSGSIGAMFDGNFHHIVVTFSATWYQLFLDGVLLNEAAYTPPAPPQSNLYFMRAEGDATTVFRADLSIPAFYQSVLPAARIKAHFDFINDFDPHVDKITSLVWMNDVNDPNQGFVDQIGNSITVLGAARVVTTTDPWGDPSGAAGWFDGASDYISLPSSVFAFGTDDFTIDFFLKVYSVATSYPVVMSSRQNGDAVTGWYLFSDQNSFGSTGALGIVIDGETTLRSTTDMVGTGWYHVEVNREGSTRRVFIDGVLEAQDTITAALDLGATHTYIAEMNGNNGSQQEVSNFRVTLGVARHSADFTPPLDYYPGP